MKVFKSTSGNVTKHLKIKQEIRKIIKIGKTAKAILKQIVTQEF